MKARDVMTPEVLTVRSDATLLDAVRLMAGRGISGLPVVDDAGKLVGLLTEGDLLQRGELGSERKRPRWLEYVLGPGRLARDYLHAHSRAVRDLMTSAPITVGPDVDLEEVADTMIAASVKRLPVVENGKILGIVSRSDLLRALVARLEGEEAAAPLSDVDIQRRLQVELNKAPWVRTGTAYCSVKDGIVELTGVIFHEDERPALKAAARSIPGVKDVRDRLSLVQPITGRIQPPPEDAVAGVVPDREG